MEANTSVNRMTETPAASTWTKAGKSTVTRQEFELEARLSAIEYMISHTLKCVYAFNNVSAETLDVADAQAADRIQNLTIDGADAAMADIFTDEMGRHVLNMIKAAREMYGK